MSNPNNPPYTEDNIPTVTPELFVYGGMNEVFEHTRTIINGMQQGDKIGMGDLVDKVAAQVEMMSAGNVANLVRIWCKQSKDVSVEVGRGGGVYKGAKKKRVDQRKRCETCNQVLRAVATPTELVADESDDEHIEADEE